MTNTNTNCIVALEPLSNDKNKTDRTVLFGYAIYLAQSKSIADWLDLQVLISQDNLGSLHWETMNHIKERGTALFKTLEQAKNALTAIERSLKSSTHLQV